MSSKAKKISKNINDSIYDDTMYRVFPGSVLICATMFEQLPKEQQLAIAKLWKKVVKSPEKYYTSETVFDIDETLKIFGIVRTFNWPVAFFEDKKTSLLAPYISNEDGDIAALPLRQNGFMPDTLSKPERCFPIDWEAK